MPKLEKSTSLYGDLGATATFLFFMYVVALLVVSAAVLNSSLHEELEQEARMRPGRDEESGEGFTCVKPHQGSRSTERSS